MMVFLGFIVSFLRPCVQRKKCIWWQWHLGSVQLVYFQNKCILRQFMRSGLYVPSLHELQFCFPITPTRVPHNMFLPAAQKVHSREMTVNLYWPAIQYVKHALSVLGASVLVNRFIPRNGDNQAQEPGWEGRKKGFF
jgi:hypothetical protein